MAKSYMTAITPPFYIADLQDFAILAQYFSETKQTYQYFLVTLHAEKTV